MYESIAAELGGLGISTRSLDQAYACGLFFGEALKIPHIALNLWRSWVN